MKLYKHLETITKEEYQKYLDEVDLGYININTHPEDENIIILNYTDAVTYERRWNEQTLSARGLILDITNANDNGLIYVLAKPFKKFFNYGENPEYERNIDFTKVQSVMEKADGSLGISYIFNGEIRFATRGSFVSEQAVKATEIWHKKYKEADEKYHRMFTEHGASPTFLVEIIYPQNRIVVDYKGEEKLVLLGTVFKDEDYSYEWVRSVAQYMRLPYLEKLEFTLDELSEMKKSISANEEGWVIRFNDDYRLKIKGNEYMAVHRILHGLSEKAKFKAWEECRLDSYIMALPEEFREELESFGYRLDNILEGLSEHIHIVFRMVYDENATRREFADTVSEMVTGDWKPFMFHALDNEGKVPEHMIRRYIFKNYKDYIGDVIQ